VIVLVVVLNTVTHESSKFIYFFERPHVILYANVIVCILYYSQQYNCALCLPPSNAQKCTSGQSGVKMV